MSREDDGESKAKEPELSGRNGMSSVPGVIIPGRGGLSDGDSVPHSERELLVSIQESLAHMFDPARDRMIERVIGLVEDDNHEQAARFVTEDDEAWMALQARNDALLDALLMVNTEQLSDDTFRTFVSKRAALACDLRRFVKAEPDIRLILAEQDRAESTVWQFRWRGALAEVALQKGYREVALHQFQALDDEMDPSIPPGDQAYVCGRIANILPKDDRDGAFFATRAKDLHLMAGDRLRAVQFQIERAIRLQNHDPRESLDLLNESLCWITEDGLLAREARARIYHLVSVLLLEHQQLEDAREAAARANQELRRLVGHEDKLISTLEIQAEIESRLHNREVAEQLREEAKLLLEDFDNPWLRTREALRQALLGPNEQATALLANVSFDPDDAEQQFWRHLVLAQTADDLEGTLTHAANALKMAANCVAGQDSQHLAYSIMGERLSQYQKPARAIEHFSKALEFSPWSTHARERLINLLWDEERWSEAASFLRKEVARLGHLPGLSYALGRSLLEAGEHREAANYLGRAVQSGSTNTAMVKDLLLRAIAEGATPPTFSEEVPREATLDDLRIQLAKFSAGVADRQRMSFWIRGSSSRRAWRSCPEDHGKQLLIAWLAASLGDRVEILEESPAGAGRIDLYLRLGTRLRVVVELKMCGGGSYTTTYAFEGLEQVSHYMEAKNTSIGFLVVFDGRTRDFGKGWQEIETIGNNTINVVTVDVRPAFRASAN